MRGPIAHWWYHTLNPWYIKNIFKRIFSKAFMKNFDGSTKKILTCMLVDTFVWKWFTTAFFIFVLDLLESNLSFNYACEGWKRKYLPAMFASFKFYPFYKVIVYSLPLIYRPVAAYFL